MNKFLLVLATTALLLQLFDTIYKSTKNKNNVCTSFSDYYSDRDNNKNCYYNPNYKLSPDEIIKRYGYPLEVYNVTTRDGYILSLYRIPHNGRTNTNKRGKPVFVQHGYLNSFASFVGGGRKSLGKRGLLKKKYKLVLVGFTLADAGYDVWLGNCRGTRYSVGHTNLSRLDSQYWDFSIHEFGVYDLPALLGFVANATNRKITYIGYSTGVSSFIIHGTMHPEELQNTVDLLIGLAPAVYLSKTFASYIYHIVMFARYIWDFLYIPDSTMLSLCFPFPIQMKACLIPSSFACGFTHKLMDPESLPAEIIHLRDILSLKAALHLIQFALTQAFSQFDYGSEMNLKKYGTEQPPPYNLSRFNIETYLVAAPYDAIVPAEAVEKLHRNLPVSVTKGHGVYMVEDEEFNHINYLNAKNIYELLYFHIIEFIKNKET